MYLLKNLSTVKATKHPAEYKMNNAWENNSLKEKLFRSSSLNKIYE